MRASPEEEGLQSTVGVIPWSAVRSMKCVGLRLRVTVVLAGERRALGCAWDAAAFEAWWAAWHEAQRTRLARDGWIPLQLRSTPEAGSPLLLEALGTFAAALTAVLVCAAIRSAVVEPSVRAAVVAAFAMFSLGLLFAIRVMLRSAFSSSRRWDGARMGREGIVRRTRSGRSELVPWSRVSCDMLDLVIDGERISMQLLEGGWVALQLLMVMGRRPARSGWCGIVLVPALLVAGALTAAATAQPAWAAPICALAALGTFCFAVWSRRVGAEAEAALAERRAELFELAGWSERRRAARTV
ncbi:MAG: hypothetical protein RLP09_35720 [Sandaracinaceae bacterium]